MLLIVVLGSLVAVAAAVRSTWSPCGLSMLSSITPFGERGRGHRYGVTAAWFVVGAVLGGATLGAVAAGGAAALAAAGVRPASHLGALLAVAVVASLGGAALDAGVFGDVIPLWRRQVDDGWLRRFRSWVYGIGFGWQIGAGVVTYIMTAAVFVTVVLAALTASPWWAAGIVTGFGTVRGLAVLLTARASTPERLRVLHRRLADAGPAVRWAVISVQAGAGLTAAGDALGGAAGAAGAVAGGAVLALVVGARRRLQVGPSRP
jgi:hypothetical protein